MPVPNTPPSTATHPGYVEHLGDVDAYANGGDPREHAWGTEAGAERPQVAPSTSTGPDTTPGAEPPQGAAPGQPGGIVAGGWNTRPGSWGTEPVGSGQLTEADVAGARASIADPQRRFYEIQDSATPAVGVTPGGRFVGAVPERGFAADPIRTLHPDRPAPAKVAIVGYTPSAQLAPYGDKAWELWGLNNLWKRIPPANFSRWFDLHPHTLIREDPEHVQWLEQGAAGLPVYTWDPHPAWPTSVAFPRDAVLSRFPGYFTNSVAWMTALAILEVAWAIPSGEAEIAIYGIDMATDSEYAAQRPSCELFIGMAMGMGIKVSIPDESDLLKAAQLYGADQSPIYVKMLARQRELGEAVGFHEQQHAQLSQQVRQCEHNIAAAKGGLDTIGYFLGVWFQPEVKRGPEEGGVAQPPG